ncbi:hypothetical protein BC941DRAFT_421277, partial [Chlamydoabsidia padenii]
MKITMFHSKQDNSKNRTTHEPISKLSRLFSKLNTVTHHHRHRHAPTTNSTLYTKSTSQIPTVGKEAIYDQDKTYEHRHYQGTIRRKNMDNDNNDNGNNDNDNSKPSGTGDSLLQHHTTYSNTGRPPITKSPSLNEIAKYQPYRPPHFNRNRSIHQGIIINESKGHNQQSTTKSSSSIQHSAELVPTILTDSRNSSKCHNNDNSCDSGLYNNDDDNGDKNGNSIDIHSHGTTKGRQQDKQLQIWDSAFWNENKMESTLNRKISAPPPGRGRREQQTMPPVLHELRRINTISNDNLDTQRYRSLQRNHSYVVKKGRFEISIETSDSTCTTSPRNSLSLV